MRKYQFNGKTFEYKLKRLLCTQCKLEKPVINFDKKPNGLGYNDRCKSCVRSRVK